MSIKKLNTKIVIKHGTASDWEASSYVPLKGELVVYEVDDTYSYPRLKIGDGVADSNGVVTGTVVKNLPFSGGIPYGTVSSIDDGLID